MMLTAAARRAQGNQPAQKRFRHRQKVSGSAVWQVCLFKMRDLNISDTQQDCFFARALADS